jgi:hypothetical protein
MSHQCPDMIFTIKCLAHRKPINAALFLLIPSTMTNTIDVCLVAYSLSSLENNNTLSS